MKTNHHFAFFDEGSKKEIRRAILKAVAIPGYQVPFSSREMPIARGWGTGGLQITLSIIGCEDVLKVIDQGSDESVNAVSIKKLVQTTTGVEVTDLTQEATIIQSRHRIPEVPLDSNQILVLQVPAPEPLRDVEAREYMTKILHSEEEYSGAWLQLFEQIMKFGRTTTGADHPVYVNHRYVMAPSPIPRFDNPKMHQSEALILLGAGREKKIYAVPPFTDVRSLAFDDYPFKVESFSGKQCRLCGTSDVFLDEVLAADTGEVSYQCNDTSYCMERLNQAEKAEVENNYA
ncbi:alpha-D-ribose 1-methylphosphonate 5-phosphate C-P-lyase PhnJ [Cytobacillus purgationiresistens]|uniref:Alpha-D-ribose 1-methylphosphonate 5-phosphate C-P lyase n=1 Tax=Cytobacillus purgationiresistens TaxID=863449 RepID=A0ABU0AKP1_9BACI|nr:alpha-D-ribose 1-methylphosphonate 5-phosphate C-P-lyase PhnJ [Cytobacillus purgationiresistens]MDQ0271842.1 alpha-D-ribose 1-methylphosphonate 5-phosphate C-P lyase [Cytobacillus purgationiresistens]